MIVVPVLMTSCHVSLNPKIGPATAQPTTTASAAMNAHGEPTWRDALAAILRNTSVPSRDALMRIVNARAIPLPRNRVIELRVLPANLSHCQWHMS